MNSIIKSRNPFLLFLPFLLFYVVFIIIMYSESNIGDEGRYIFFANNLLHGFYSPPAPNINLLSGPGYPIILLPFVALHLPKIGLILLNAVFHYLSIIFLFKTLYQFVSYKKTVIFSLFWACYYVAYQNMSRVSTEPFAMLLVILLIFCLSKAFNQTKPKQANTYTGISGFVFGYLALTKVIFAPIIIFMTIGIFFLWVINRKTIIYLKGVFILLIAFATLLPYLAYTYSITNRLMYFGTGSDNIYWMSTPYEGEYGDWKGPLTINPVYNGNYNIPGAGDTLIAHHQKDYEEIYKLKGELEQDDAFKRIAIENIKSNPYKYAQNIFFNFGRMIFHYPFSHAIQRPKPLYVMPLNGILLTFILLSIIPTFINWRKILFPIRFLLFIALLYMGASSLISAETRMFTIIVPILLVWFAFIIQKTLKINIKEWTD
jgi:hypothetical protein